MQPYQPCPTCIWGGKHGCAWLWKVRSHKEKLTTIATADREEGRKSSCVWSCFREDVGQKETLCISCSITVEIQAGVFKPLWCWQKFLSILVLCSAQSALFTADILAWHSRERTYDTNNINGGTNVLKHPSESDPAWRTPGLKLEQPHRNQKSYIWSFPSVLKSVKKAQTYSCSSKHTGIEGWHSELHILTEAAVSGTSWLMWPK